MSEVTQTPYATAAEADSGSPTNRNITAAASQRHRRNKYRRLTKAEFEAKRRDMQIT